MTLYLSSFFGTRVVVDEDENGEKEEGLFIPIEKNALVCTNGKWLAWGFVQEMLTPMKGFTHRVMQKATPAYHSRLKEEGLSSPLLARLKPIAYTPKRIIRNNINNRVDYNDFDI